MRFGFLNPSYKPRRGLQLRQGHHASHYALERLEHCYCRSWCVWIVHVRNPLSPGSPNAALLTAHSNRSLHLAAAGYKNVTVFDYQPYEQNAYSTTDGADAASADLNKVMRLSYGEEVLYQRLAFEALPIWEAWNRELAATPTHKLPKGLKQGDNIWNNCGFLRLSADGKLSEHEKSTLANLTADGLRDTQYIIGDPRDEARAKANGWHRKFDALKRKERGQNLVGVLDTTAGFVEASKACLWTLYLARKAGVKFVLGNEVGRVDCFLKERGRTVGIKTADGLEHKADLVILAGKLRRCSGYSLLNFCRCSFNPAQLEAGLPLCFHPWRRSWKPLLAASSTYNSHRSMSVPIYGSGSAARSSPFTRGADGPRVPGSGDSRAPKLGS